MAEQFTKSILKVVVAQISQTIGWHGMQSTALEMMVDVLHRYLQEVTRMIHRYAEHCGHTTPTLDDLGMAFREMGISIQDLEEYVRYVDPVPCVVDVPKYPVANESHLNFLKPGSREVVHRPVHVHEHLPPMHPEMEEQGQLCAESPNNSGSTSPLSSPKSSVFKRPGDPISLEASPTKRSRFSLEEEGRPLREISSVMMTTSGFLSPAREGKLPEARIPLQPSDSRSNSPQPPSYPMVPPEVKGEKKTKKVVVKKSGDGVKKTDKENKRKELKDLMKHEKESLNEETAVKKLVAMKEFLKLKPLKPGALKLIAHSAPTVSGSNTPKSPKISIPKLSPIKSQNLNLPKSSKTSGQSKSPKIEKAHLIVPQPKVTSSPEKSKDSSGIVDGKLSSEPDKQKLNIFKKISKVKEEKVEKAEKIEKNEPLDATTKDSRESSPGLVIDEVEIQNRQREARLSQINDCIDAVIQRGMKECEHDEKDGKPSRSPAPQTTETMSKVDSTINDVVSMAHSPDYGKDVYLFDDNDLSPPGTPSTPKTPELPTPTRKAEKTTEKKRKKDKSKSKRESKGKSKDNANHKKVKLEVSEPETPERPKTPEVPETRDDIHTPVFPFFPHFPPAPGLIPPPLRHPLFPRFPLPPYGKHGLLGQSSLGPNLPHPAMPNLPMPPPLFMQPRVEELDSKEKNLDKTPSVSGISALNVENNEKLEKIHSPNSSPPKIKSVEKKGKERKKDKKEKDKVKKKKEKKDKVKGKDKSEKKKDKEDKKDKDKPKEKKEKKEKRKDKERNDEKSESSVPKITFKITPTSSSPPPPDPQAKKIVIKPVIKKDEKSEHTITLTTSESAPKRPPSPVLAKFSALITRPPKQKPTTKSSKQESSAETTSTVQPQQSPTPQSSEQTSSEVPTPPFTETPPSGGVMAQSSIPVTPPQFNQNASTSKVKKAPTKTSPKIKIRDNIKKPAADGDGTKETVAFYYDNEGNKVWICPACGGQDDGSPMIGCDDCDAWYHWVCVGIQVPPDDSEDWYCRVCIVKKQEIIADKKKKARKKK